MMQGVDTCLICSQICGPDKIPVDIDRNRGNTVYACSYNCQQMWQALLAQMLQQQQQQQQQQVLAAMQQVLAQGGSQQQPYGNFFPGFTPTDGQFQQQQSQPQQQQQQNPPPSQSNYKRPSTSKPVLYSNHATNQPEAPSTSVTARVPEEEPAPKKIKSESTEPKPASSNEKTDNVSNNTETKVVHYRTLYVVADTNVLLEHLIEILNLRVLESVTVVIPTVVIHELDGLKRSEDESVSSRSKSALRIIHESLLSNASLVKKWMRGQSPHEVLGMSETLVPLRNNDDQILNCALYFLRRVASPEDGLILTTNDEGLRLKALLSNVETKNVTQLLSCLPVKSSGGPLTIVLDAPKKGSVASFMNAALPRQELPLQNNVMLWKNILSHLPPRELPKMSGVCFSFYQMINGDDHVWRSSVQNTFQDRAEVLIPSSQSAKQWYIRWRRQTLTISAFNI
ncbi:hypothetical protein PROFUN_13258 [Planoprotostelium fungivorum]|uniref:PIN domain-containing protein n=1 Tax=Planoprotostelium fungivorum TaxID=1890364 RepID=A0A2P6N4Y9_9EUKA|nr:hypothetical protein PROFUN_13258 [Planoprotostelium fungivorum]